MPNKYNNIQGWFDFQNIYEMAVKLYPKGNFIELGSWFGKSTCFMAELIKEQNLDINFFAIDLFENYVVEDKGENVYFKFLKNMIESDVANKVIPIKSKTQDAAVLFADKSIDFIFVDASHLYQEVFDDLTLYYPKLKDNGTIGGHDYNGEVAQAVNDFFKGKKQITSFNGSWIASAN